MGTRKLFRIEVSFCYLLLFSAGSRLNSVHRRQKYFKKVQYTFVFRCYSPVGRQYRKRGMQELSIGEGCNNKGIIMHELMHALGFWHEQARSDRDDYLEVLWENIKKGTLCLTG